MKFSTHLNSYRFLMENIQCWQRCGEIRILKNAGGNAKVESQEIPGVRGKFGCGVQNEGGQRLTQFCQENAWVIANTLFLQHKRRLYTWTSPDGK